MIDKRVVRVDRLLMELLQKRRDSPFSCTEIRDAYLVQIPESQRPDKNGLRKHIYRELLRLESATIINRNKASRGRGCKFIYPSASDDKIWEAKPSPFAPRAEQSELSMDPTTLRALQDQLSKRKVELIASIGEAEEYQRLYNEFPALHETVRTQYLESRDRSTKLLGQLRAVETVLTQIGSQA